MEKIKLQHPATQHKPKLGTQQMNYPVHKQENKQDNKQENKQAVQNVKKSLCESHMHRYVEIQAADGYCYDGILEHVDDEWVCLAVPGAVENHMRGFYPYYSPYSQFGSFYPYRPRRFSRLALPLAGVSTLSLLPYY